MNEANYLLKILAWQNANAGKKHGRSKAPEPFVPDFLKGSLPKGGVAKDSQAKPIGDIKTILAKPRK